MRISALWLLLFSGCLDFEKQLALCAEAGKCETAAVTGALGFSAAELDFFIVDAGENRVQIVVLSNLGRVPSGPVSFEIVAGEAGAFSVEAGSCVSGLSAGATCPLSVSFHPRAPGPAQGSLQASCPAAGPATVALTGGGRVDVPLPPAGAHLLFVTEATYPIGSAAVAGGRCQAEANAASLGGVFFALLAEGSASAADDIPRASEPLYRPDGVVVALHTSDLANPLLPPLAPITVTALRTHVEGPVWTGSGAVDARAVDQNCDDWVSQASSAIVGEAGLSGPEWWARSLTLGCGQSARIYCIR